MAIVSKKVFITPSVFLAFIDRADQKHEQAAAFFRFFSQERYFLYTDTTSLNETYNQMRDAMSHTLAKDFLRTISFSNINLMYPDESDIKAAIKTCLNYRSGELTFQEAQMAVLADRRGISQICTFEYLHPLFGLRVFYLPI